MTADDECGGHAAGSAEPWRRLPPAHGGRAAGHAVPAGAMRDGCPPTTHRSADGTDQARPDEDGDDNALTSLGDVTVNEQ